MTTACSLSALPDSRRPTLCHSALEDFTTNNAHKKTGHAVQTPWDWLSRCAWHKAQLSALLHSAPGVWIPKISTTLSSATADCQCVRQSLVVLSAEFKESQGRKTQHPMCKQKESADFRLV